MAYPDDYSSANAPDSEPSMTKIDEYLDGIAAQARALDEIELILQRLEKTDAKWSRDFIATLRNMIDNTPVRYCEHFAAAGREADCRLWFDEVFAK